MNYNLLLINLSVSRSKCKKVVVKSASGGCECRYMRHANVTNHTSSHPRGMRRHQILLLHTHPDHTFASLKTYIYPQKWYDVTVEISKFWNESHHCMINNSLTLKLLPLNFSCKCKMKCYHLYFWIWTTCIYTYEVYL